MRSDDLDQRLAGLAEDGAGHARPPTPATIRRRNRRRRRRQAAGVVLVGLALAGAMVAVRADRPAPTPPAGAAAEPDHRRASASRAGRPLDRGAGAANTGQLAGAAHGPSGHAGLHGGPAPGVSRLGGRDRLAGRLPDHPAG